ncbi:uncharacterized protein [Littorina saxatilis]|uniref:BTB domain-containing protein n=1 Tax=Littorina saxatilis TaxID=31220 RepID=A0AAN9BZK5_9CAEN
MGEYTYSLVASHCSELLVFMDEQRKAKDENLCDVRFIVGSDCVYAHRGVLAVCSAYFQGLLSGAFCESQGEDGTKSRMMEIDFTGSVSNIAHLDTLLSAAYTGCLKLSPENITGVTELACFLLVERVRAVCEVFLLETLTLHTCLRYLKLAYHYDLTLLFKAGRQLLQSRFHDYFIHRPEMLTVSAGCLIMVPKIYKYVDAQDVGQFLVSWVEGELDRGEVSNNREERLSTACNIFTDKRVCWKGGGREVLPSLLVGNKDIIEELLSQSVAQGVHVIGADSSECCEAEKMDVSESSQDVQTELAESCAVKNSDEVTLLSEDTDSGVTVKGSKSLDTGENICGPLADESSNNFDDTQRGNIPDIAIASSSSDKAQTVSSNELINQSQKRDLDSLYFPFESPKKQKTTEPTVVLTPELNKHASDTCDVLVAFVPGKAAVSYFTATDCEKGRPRFCAIDFEVCVYNIQQRQWLWAGTATFPEKFEERDAWRVTCVNCKAYFLSLHRQTLYVLDLKSMVWSPLNCRPLVAHLSLNNNKIRSLVPIAVDSRLYVLASDRQWDTDRHEYLCKQRYFRLAENNRWEMIVDVEHTHSSTPLTVLTVSDSKVCVVKATIAVNLEKSMLIVKEGHIFDCAKGEVKKFSGTTYAASPMRVMVRDGQIHMVDGDSLQRRMLLDIQAWEDLGKVDLSDIKIARSASGESYLPCLSHNATNMGASVWEFCAFLDHRSVLTELRVTEEHKAETVRHPPPPFRYVTATTACQLSRDFVASLNPCRYLHADIRQ